MAVSVVSSTTHHIESKIKEGSNALSKIKSEANALLSELNVVNQLLFKLEEEAQLNSSYEFRSWASELRKIAFEAEDEVDNLLTESSTSSILYRLGVHRVLKKLRGLTDRAVAVKNQLMAHAEGSKGSKPKVALCARGSQAPKGHAPANDDLFIGIDDEIKKIVDLLAGKSELIDGPNDKLAIVGMGGCGKTTFVRSIYNHKAIKRNFCYRAWVSVSQGWDTSNVLIAIIKQIQEQKPWFWQRNQDAGLENLDDKKLANHLTDILYEKNCLLVLDDVWRLESLQEFIKLLEEDDEESRTYTIVITSRQSPINRNMWSIYQPECLSDEDSWKLFSRVASNSSKALGDEYRALAMEMMKKCQGLPLGIVALGRLLKTKVTMQEWQRVLYKIESAESTSMYDINEIIGLSYAELPSHLQPCFLYMGLFPEGSTISGGTLIRMWIAEGFVESNSEKDSEEALEVVGRRYLQELIDHTMVQVVRKNYADKPTTIRIHDMMRNFCISRARDLDFLALSSSGPEAIGKTSRRIAIDLSKSLNLPVNNPHLRSVTLFGQSSTNVVPERYSNQVNQRYVDFGSVCQLFKLLRVLDIFGIKSPDGSLPGEIGTLIHLTYLRIRSTNIQKLPNSIGKLKNLLTLDYWDVSGDKEVEVPDVLWKLEKLRHLYLPNEMSGSVKSLKLDTLKDLITLWGVGGGDWMLKEMGKLSTASRLGKLYIHRISTADQLQAVFKSPIMKENDSLYALALDWYNFQIEDLDALCSKRSLTKLRLFGRAPDTSCLSGRRFPSNLGKLELYYTRLENPETMSLLGKLVSLKVLRLSKDSYIGSEWHCSEDSFPALEEMKLTNLPKLETWEMEEGAMSCLTKLSIVSCIMLKRMPEELKHIQSLKKLDIERMPSKFTSKLQKVSTWRGGRDGEDFHIIKNISQVVIPAYSWA